MSQRPTSDWRSSGFDGSPDILAKVRNCVTSQMIHHCISETGPTEAKSTKVRLCRIIFNSERSFFSFQYHRDFLFLENKSLRLDIIFSNVFCFHVFSFFSGSFPRALFAELMALDLHGEKLQCHGPIKGHFFGPHPPISCCFTTEVRFLEQFHLYPFIIDITPFIINDSDNL